MPLDPTNAGQVQYAIVQMMEQLDDLVDQYRVDTEQAAVSHANYKRVFHSEMLRVVNGRKASNADGRLALVEEATNDERATAEVHAARADATKAALFALQAKLEAARSLNANVRNLT